MSDTLDRAFNWELDIEAALWDNEHHRHLVQPFLDMAQAARLVADGKEVWLCGGGKGPMRPGKSLDLSCIFTSGHFPACGRYVQAVLTPPGDTK